jgi:magnesium-protoporphyrin IX monomethyl ester (oxidative) cyclase
LKNLQRAPLLAGFASELIGLLVMPPVDSGSVDITKVAENDPAFMY